MQLAELLPKFAKKHRIIEILCRMGLQNKLYKVRFNGDSIAIINLMDPEPRNVFIRGEFETHFFEIAKFFLPNQGVLFDLGANVGFCSFGMLPTNPECHYHLFEANPRMIELLKHSIMHHKDYIIKLNHACVTDKKGTTKFCITDRQSGQSHVATSEEKGIPITNLKLDDYCHKNDIRQVDFAKIDLEGHEHKALLGWQNCLQQKTVKAIYIETIPENQNRYQLSTNETLIYLESFGYKMYLCKDDDFKNFPHNTEPLEIILKRRSLKLGSFKAKDYPMNYSTDILALASNF